jgi:hypothetical protein
MEECIEPVGISPLFVFYTKGWCTIDKNVIDHNLQLKASKAALKALTKSDFQLRLY